MSEEEALFGFGAGLAGALYGSREGDIWLSTGSEIQERLDADGEGLQLVHEMMLRDGRLEEVLYVTDNPEILAEAQAGHARYVEAIAKWN